MLAVRAFCFLFPLVWLSLATPIAKPGCQPSCGNISIPYPYGIGSSKDGDACFLNEFYNISCVETADHPPKAFLKGKNIEILNISINGQILVKSFVATAFYKKGQVVNSTSVEDEADISSYPMVYSYTENKLITIGCDDYAVLGRVSASESALTGGCIAGCEDLSVVVNGSCSGVGCCQTSIPIALFKYNLMLGSLKNHTTVDKRNPYGYAFIGKPSKFNFTVADLGDPDFAKRTRDTVPVVIDWFVRYDTFSSAYPTVSYNDFTNHINIKCHDYKPCHGGCGQQCSCLPGYQGNPYLRPGCTVLGLLLLPPVGWWLYFMNKKRKVVKQKAKNFKKNGGLLMRRRMSSDERLMERAYFFTIDELETATDHFNESRILGRGGQGIVYKGMLGEGRLVAVKKSTTLNESQQEDFINEVVIMSQVIHRSIVRLLGFCLDSEVPILVYEFIPNGTLFNNLHHLYEEFPITWTMRLQIASDLARALLYLHSFSYVPILHRDIKSSNILLDDKYRAKLSDFGLSKNVALDQTHVSTDVKGTFGYLDPEFFETSQYTEKSDVYSFGVVLVELLTGQKAIRAMCEQERSLVSWFLSHMKNSQLLVIVDPQLLKESSKEEVYTIADLAIQCLNKKGKRRPAMKEVLLVLETAESRHIKLAQTDEVQTSSILEQVLTAGITCKSNDENVVASSTSSMETPYFRSAEVSFLSDTRRCSDIE
uniref:Protein kinase domain-containing protein n=1 Tax=Chenopodium quinoa TaxID=63459 RepID=A0A803LVM8_CHEQI